MQAFIRPFYWLGVVLFYLAKRKPVSRVLHLHYSLSRAFRSKPQPQDYTKIYGITFITKPDARMVEIEVYSTVGTSEDVADILLVIYCAFLATGSLFGVESLTRTGV